ncbi:MAG: peptidylprolyl isomerase, partial [Alphaproteobacteria bacterium]
MTQGDQAMAVEATDAANDEAENTLHMELKDGMVVIRMRPDLAPGHCARIRDLVRQKFYDGL